MASTQHTLPTRTATNVTDDDAIPDEDTSEVTKLFHERLQAWKHACGYLEDYVSATEKMQHTHAKEYEKVLKVSSHCSHDMYQDAVLTIYGRLYRVLSKKATTSTRTWAVWLACLILSAATLRYGTTSCKRQG
jgi:glycyl-tRNA synthetase beta subunit